MKSKKNVYEIITAELIARLEAGACPWRRPWNATGAGAPANLCSKKPYRGINMFLLSMIESPCNYYVTFNQAKKMGGSVKKGAHAKTVTFWKILKYGDPAGDMLETGDDEKRIPFLRYYNVFNALDDCEGLEDKIPQPAPTREHNPIAAAENIVSAYKDRPEIRHAGGRAYYSPAADRVTMPEAKHFETGEHYYTTLFHELAHSTGHRSRLDRPDIGSSSFGSNPYAREELVAEMAASMLSGLAGISAPVLDNSAAYLQSWIHALKGDAKLAIQAASAAQKAADYITGTTYEPEAEETAQEPRERPAPAPKHEPEPEPAGAQLTLF